MTFSIETALSKNVRLYNNESKKEMSDSIINPKVIDNRGDDAPCLFQIIELKQQDEGSTGECSIAIKNIKSGQFVSCRKATWLPYLGWSALTEYRSDIGEFERFMIEQDSQTGLYTFKSHNGMYMSINRKFSTVAFRPESDSHIRWSISLPGSSGNYFLNKMMIDDAEFEEYIEHLGSITESGDGLIDMKKAIENDLKQSIEAVKNLKEEDFHIPEAVDAGQNIKYVLGIFSRFQDQEKELTDKDKEDIANATKRVTELIDRIDLNDCPEKICNIIEKMKDALNDDETSFIELLAVSLFLNKIKEKPRMIGDMMEGIISSIESLYEVAPDAIMDVLKEVLPEGLSEVFDNTVAEVISDAAPVLGLVRGTHKFTWGTMKVASGLVGVTIGSAIGIGSTITYIFNKDVGEAGAHICKHMIGSSSFILTEGVVQAVHGTSCVAGQVPGTQGLTIPINVITSTAQRKMENARNR